MIFSPAMPLPLGWLLVITTIARTGQRSCYINATRVAVVEFLYSKASIYLCRANAIERFALLDSPWISETSFQNCRNQIRIRFVHKILLHSLAARWVHAIQNEEADQFVTELVACRADNQQVPVN